LITATAQQDGAIVVEIESKLGASELRAFTTTCSVTNQPEGCAVMSWEIGHDRLLRVAISGSGEFLAVRSSIPAALGFPGGTYSMLPSPITSA
jgi:hypothetical protein